jgi:hypothetical protein
VLVEELGDELVVYDLDGDHAHLLSPNVARVWRAAADGCTVGELRGIVGAESAEQAEFLVWEAIEALRAASLLEGVVLTPSRPTGMTRRTLLKRLAIASIAIPTITTIATAAPAAAFTCSGTCQLNGATPTPCPGETTPGTGNCRCSKDTGSGACAACRGTGSLTECRLCCNAPPGCTGTTQGVCL